jgi:hypothetical protein
MRRKYHAGQSYLILSVALVALLAFGLAACGSSGGAGPGSGSTPTPTPTAGQGYGTAHGCLSDAVVTPDPPTANVTATLSQANRALTAHVGDVIEIQLPFGLRWSGPVLSGGSLQLQTPAGYASPSKGMCIWRLNAPQAGTTTLTFSARALCVAGQLCPQFVLAVPFTMAVK